MQQQPGQDVVDPSPPRPEPERHAHPPACFSCTLALAAATPAASCTAKRQDKMHCTAASRPPRARASLAPAHDRPSPWLCSPASPLLPDPLAPCDAVSAPAPAGMRAAGGGTRTSRFCGRARRRRDEEGSEQRRQPVGSTRSARRRERENRGTHLDNIEPHILEAREARRRAQILEHLAHLRAGAHLVLRVRASPHGASQLSRHERERERGAVDGRDAPTSRGES